MEAICGEVLNPLEDFHIYLSQTDRLFAVAMEGQGQREGKAIISLVHNTCN